MNSPRDELTFLLRSSSRLDALLTIGQHRTLSRSQLNHHLDGSRRTVSRALESLVDKGLLQDYDGSYRLSAYGKEIMEAYQQYCDHAELPSQLRPFLRYVDPDLFSFDLSCLSDAELVVSTESGPYVILDRVLQLRAEADLIREFGPAVERKSFEQLETLLTGSDPPRYETLPTEDAHERAQTRSEYQELYQILLDAEAAEIQVYPDSFPLYLMIADDTVLMSVGEANPYQETMLVSDHPDVHAWAVDFFEQHKAEATPAPDY